jgi:hypothetical protein
LYEAGSLHLDFDSSDLVLEHPPHRVIHRRVESNNPDIVGPDANKINLAIAKGNEIRQFRESNGTTSQRYVEATSTGSGMSCSSACQYVPFLWSGGVTLNELKSLLPKENISINEDRVNLNGTEYNVIYCYSRELEDVVSQYGTISVECALHDFGQQDACLMGEGELFCCYFDNKQHGNICLRHKMVQSETTWKSIINGHVQFDSAAFHLDKWKYCGDDTIHVKFPREFMTDVANGKSVPDVVSKIKNETVKKAAENLFELFMNSDLNTAEEVSCVLGSLCHTSSENIADKYLWAACDIIEKNAEVLFGENVYLVWDLRLKMDLQDLIRSNNVCKT